MAYDEGLAQRIREILVDQEGITERKMFGGIGFMLHGNLVCGVNRDELMLRVWPEKHEQFLQKRNVRPFDFTGRPMKGWITVTPEGVESEEALKRWVNQGLDFVLTLPPK